MRFHIILAATIAAAQPALATPLVTSSEDTVARVCLSGRTAPERVVAACDAALFDARLTQAQRVDMLVARGDGQFWLGDYAGAEASYRSALEIDPRGSEAWNGLGWTLWETEGDAAAHEAFAASVAIDVSVQGLGGAAATGRRSGAMTNAEAQAMLDAALAIDPDYTWAIRELGWSHLDTGDDIAAGERFGQAVAADPNDLNALYGLGRARLNAGDAGAALTHFNAVLAAQPGDLPARVYRITALRRLDRNAQALREADRLIADEPDRASGYIERGKALIGLERRAEAIETYRAAETAVGPNNAILYWLADALATDERFAEALEVIDRGLTMKGADHSDHLLKSYIALEMGDHSTARQSAEASLATGVEDPWAHYYVAISLVRGGEIPAGMARFDRAISAGLPEDRIGAFARELIQSGQYVEAAGLRLKY